MYWILGSVKESFMIKGNIEQFLRLAGSVKLVQSNVPVVQGKCGCGSATQLGCCLCYMLTNCCVGSFMYLLVCGLMYGTGEFVVERAFASIPEHCMKV